MENKKLKIGIDLDDVVFEFTREFLEYYNEKFGKKLRLEDVFSYRFWDVLNLPKGDVSNLFNEFISLKNQRFSLCKYAKEIIFHLYSEGHEIYFITSRVFREGTLESLKEIFFEIPFELIFSHNPYLENEGKTKGEICKELGIDFMIEDSYEHAISCIKNGVFCFILDKPWNRHRENHKNIFVVNDWKQILEVINEHY